MSTRKSSSIEGFSSSSYMSGSCTFITWVNMYLFRPWFLLDILWRWWWMTKVKKE